MAFIGHPILGDVKYGAPEPLPNQEIGLYAHKLVSVIPFQTEEITLTALEPKTWEQFKL
jgi:Pseudouridylate synthases, 23S RNA-specific